ncbi:MAG: baseplate J/gp47 family protein [Rhodoblastus sp.]|nr:MAG: baseplate J/gp47 family protein [Rhodoblastus sp.]
MSRFTPIDLAAYPVGDVLETLAYESYLARDRATFSARWSERRALDPTLPALDGAELDSDPTSAVLQVGATRETLLRARVNDALRSLTLAGAKRRALDHIGVTYYRAARRVITPASGSTPAVMEGDEVYRQRLALTPESWSTAGPVGAYLWHALSASGDVLDVAVYSEDEGVCLAPTVRVVILSRQSDGWADAGLLDAVRTALRRSEIRPLADEVIVESATPLAWDLWAELTVRPGVSPTVVADAARTRLAAYAAGQLRWIGDGEDGPVWLIGRAFREETLAGVAMGGDPNIIDVDIRLGASALGVNLPDARYTDDALALVGADAFQPLPLAWTRHLFVAPRLVALSVTTKITGAGWSA